MNQCWSHALQEQCWCLACNSCTSQISYAIKELFKKFYLAPNLAPWQKCRQPSTTSKSLARTQQKTPKPRAERARLRVNKVLCMPRNPSHGTAVVSICVIIPFGQNWSGHFMVCLTICCAQVVLGCTQSKWGRGLVVLAWGVGVSKFGGLIVSMRPTHDLGDLMCRIVVWWLGLDEQLKCVAVVTERWLSISVLCTNQIADIFCKPCSNTNFTTAIWATLSVNDTWVWQCKSWLLLL